MARGVENNGIGAIYGTFIVDKTGNNYDLATSDIGCAVSLSGDNEVDKGIDGGKLLGKLVVIQDDLATVQISGILRLNYNTSKTTPEIGDAVIVDGAGKVYQSPEGSSVPAGGLPGRGIVVAVNTTSHTCDILL